MTAPAADGWLEGDALDYHRGYAVDLAQRTASASTPRSTSTASSTATSPVWSAKGKAKTSTRTYGFLAALLPYSNAGWEKLAIFLDQLLPKLPAPREDDLSAGILETVDMESYRIEKREAVRIALADDDGALEPVPTSGGGHVSDPELDRLSSILQTFNDQFGNIEWTDADRVHRLITEDIPRRVAEDDAYRNAQLNNDPDNAGIEHDRALGRAMMAVLKDDTELFKQFSDNDGFKRWLSDAIFQATYRKSA